LKRAKAFPYQLLAAYQASGKGVPPAVREAPHDAMELATANVPALEGKVYVCPDVSGSMSWPVTGHRAGVTSAVRCIDVAALVAAAVLRKNPEAEVLPFEQEVVDIRLTGRDSVMTNAQKLASIGGGGTNCSAPLRRLNQKGAKGNLVVFVSDNESWVDARAGRGTATLAEWSVFMERSRARSSSASISSRTGRRRPRSVTTSSTWAGSRTPSSSCSPPSPRGGLDADHRVGAIERTALA
jgi:60 kDa SS-A/Ro ribonucleoprotein